MMKPIANEPETSACCPFISQDNAAQAIPVPPDTQRFPRPFIPNPGKHGEAISDERRPRRRWAADGQMAPLPVSWCTYTHYLRPLPVIRIQQANVRHPGAGTYILANVIVWCPTQTILASYQL